MRYANVKLVMNTLCLEPKLEIYIYILLFQRMPAILYFFISFGYVFQIIKVWPGHCTHEGSERFAQPQTDMFFRSYRIGFMSPSCGTLYMFYGECDWDYLSFMSIELYPHEIINLHLHHHFQPAPLAQGRRGSMSERLTLPSGCGLLLLAAVTQWTPHGCRKGQGSHCVWMDSLSRNRMRTVTKHCMHIEGCQSPSGYHFGPGH
jgi:hypothetical protein